MGKYSKNVLESVSMNDSLELIEKKAAINAYQIIEGSLRLCEKDKQIEVLLELQQGMNDELIQNDSITKKIINDNLERSSQITIIKDSINELKKKKDSGVKLFAFSNNHLAAFVLFNLLTLFSLVSLGAPFLIILSTVFIGSAGILLKEKIECNINKYLIEKEMKFIDGYEEELKNKEAEIKKLESSIITHGYIMDYNFNIKIALTEALSIITERIIVEQSSNIKKNMIKHDQLNNTDQIEKEKVKTLKRF